MIEITFLGTACMQPTKERNHVGILLSYKNQNILFDCGENIQRQLKQIRFKPTKITKIFLSHWHGDHILGLPGLMCTMGADQSTQKLQIYGPSGTKKHMEYLLKAFLSKYVIEHEIFEIVPKNKNSSKIIDFPDFFIEAASLEHNIPCLGYSFIQKDRRRIKPKFTKKIPGILLGKLQKNQPILYQNKKITPQEVTYLVKGKKITILMDTRPCDNYLKLAQGADILISESTYLQDQKEKAEEYFHMTAQEAALLANRAQVKKLVLLHFSPRYKDISQFREEAKTVFKEVICAEDFMKIKL